MKNLKLKQAQNKLKQAYLKVQMIVSILKPLKYQLKIAKHSIPFCKFKQRRVKTMTDVEGKRMKLQETEAKLLHKKTNILLVKTRF